MIACWGVLHGLAMVAGLGVWMPVETVSANEAGVNSEPYGQESNSWLATSIMSEHSGQLKHLVWIIPLILFSLYSYLPIR